MGAPRRLLLVAILILALGCYLVIGGKEVSQTDLTTYLGMACIVLSVCVAALIEAVHGQHKQIAELERKLSERQSLAESTAAVDHGRGADS